ncbi:hypothetical protein K0M31_008559, partial [Melipona bicolor]
MWKRNEMLEINLILLGKATICSRPKASLRIESEDRTVPSTEEEEEGNWKTSESKRRRVETRSAQ